MSTPPRTPGPVQRSIYARVADSLAPTTLEVMNESHTHNVPPGSETHFRVRVVSEAFAGVSRVGRHRKLHAILAEELAVGVHALALELHTPEEWARRGAPRQESPPCLGGNGK